MTFSRPWLPLFVAGCFLSGMARAQDDAGSAAAPAPAPGPGAAGSAPGAPAAGAAPGGASSAFGTAPSSPSTGTVPNAPSQGATPFGTQTPDGRSPAAPGQAAPGTGTGTGTESDNAAAGGSASAFGSTDAPGVPQLKQAPASFTLPGFYGRGPQTFTVGEGRLARPKFRISGNVSLGYDDNVFQTPTHGQSAPAQKVQVQETAGSPAGSVQVLVPSGDPNVPDSVQTVQIPAVAPKFRTVTIPAVPEAQRIASWITRTDAKWDVQLANRRTLFTFDLGGGVDYYWNRPGKKEDYTGNLSLVYLRRLTGRAQFTMAIDATYQSQPDFSQPNTPTSSNLGSYLTANAKADLSYRLTPRFSTVTSVSYNTVQYQEKTVNSGNYASITFGEEVRYLFSPRLTLLGEVRYSADMHSNDSAQDTTSYFVLVGGEIALSRRFNATLRVGEQVQTFKQQGDQSSSPYVEGTLNYRLAQRTTLSLNARYGYEEAGTANTTSLVARGGLQLTQIFTPRFQSVLTMNLLRTSASSTSDVLDTPAASSTDTNSSLTGSTGTTGTIGTSPRTSTASNSNSSGRTHSVTSETVQDTLDASLGFYYTLDRHWSFNLTYSYTMVVGPESTFDYFRQRVFLGAAYQF